MSAIIKIAILANAANAVRGMRDTSDAAEKMGSKVTGSASKLAGLAAGAIGIGTVTAAFKVGADEAAAFQDAANQTTAALKTNANLHGLTAAQVQKNSAALESLTGAKIDENDATLAQDKLIRAGVTTQKGLQDALKASSDVALATGKDIGAVSTSVSKALADPTKAQGVLAKAGIVLSKAQQDSIDAMVKSGDTAGAQGAVIAALESKYKGASEAAGKGFSADLGRAKDALADAERDIVTNTLPALSKLATLFAENLPKAIAFLTPIFQGLWTVVSNPAFLTLAGVVLAIVAGFQVYAGVMAVVSAVTKAYAAVQTVLNVVMSANPIGIVVIALVALVAGIVLAYQHSQKFRDIVDAALHGVVAAFNWLVDSVKGVFTWLGSAWDSVISTFSDIGSKIMRGLGDGIDSGLKWIKDKVSGLGSLIPDWLKSVLGIHSPSRVMAGIGRNIVQGLGDGMTAQLPALRRTLGTVNDTITGGFSDGSVSIPGQTPIAVGGGTGSNSYAINVNVPPTADPAEVGRQVVNTIEAYERRSGRRRLATAT